MKAIFITILTIAPLATFAQGHEWTVVGNKATMQSVITAPGQDANQIYKHVNRWLLATFKNPEHVVKARIESEYVRGDAYHANVYQLGALSSVDFRYTFTIDIKDEKLRLTLSRGLVLYDNPQQRNIVQPLEYYFGLIEKKKKKTDHPRKLIAAINTMSSELVRSLQNYLQTEYSMQDDW
jgi:hypothetical protein